MSDDEHQIEVPPSFIALFVPPGRIKPTASLREIRERYEYCEDLANMLTDTASTKLWQLGVSESDVLERVGQGLQGGQAGVSDTEAEWVLRRLAELLGWSVQR
ncbi:MAG: ATPase with chaperone activity [Rhizobacter sp.]